MKQTQEQFIEEANAIATAYEPHDEEFEKCFSGLLNRHAEIIREEVISEVKGYGEDIQLYFDGVVGDHHEDFKDIQVNDAFSRLIAIRHLLKRLSSFVNGIGYTKK